MKRNSLLLARAKTMRSAMTRAERIMWRQLRAKRFYVWKFYRQLPIDHFIVDFCCPERKLIIEIDGDIHWEDGRQFLDEWRTSRLRQCGYRVIRFGNYRVMTNTDGVLEELEEALRYPLPLPPLPALSPERGGEGSA